MNITKLLTLAFACALCAPALAQESLLDIYQRALQKDPAIREHTAHVLGLMGPAAKPLSNQLLRLAGDDKVEQVRAIAFDSLRTVGVSDVPGLAALMNRKDPMDVKRRAAEIISVLPEIPPFAVSSLSRALDDDDEVIRVSAAMGLIAAGPKGASKEAAAYLLGAIRKNFPPEFDPKLFRPDDPQFIYFTALTTQGKLGVPPAVELLKHKNWLVRYLALQTLGDIGKDAKEAIPQVRDLDSDPEVALESIVTLYRIGDDELEKGIRLIGSGFASSRPQDVVACIEVVSRLGKPGQALVPEALKQLDSASPEARFAAVGLVGTLEPVEAAKQVPKLTKLASDEQPLIRRRVGTVLEKLGPAAAPAAEAIGQALIKEKDEATREQFVDALVAMGPAAKPAVVGLAPLLSESSTSISLRIKVIGALVQADPASKEAEAALIVAANDRDVSVRKAAAGAIGKLDPLPDDARAVLVKMMKSDSSGAVQTAAVRGLAVAGPRAKGAKPDLEAAAKGGLPGSALWAKVALTAVEGDITKAGGTIREGLTARNGTVRVAAAEALALIGPTAADVPALIKLSRESTSGATEAAARALGLAGPAAKDAVPRLIELLTGSDADTRLAAAEALGRIGLPSAAPAIPKLKDAIRANPALAPTIQKALDRLGAKDSGPKK